MRRTRGAPRLRVWRVGLVLGLVALGLVALSLRPRLAAPAGVVLLVAADTGGYAAAAPVAAEAARAGAEVRVLLLGASARRDGQRRAGGLVPDPRSFASGVDHLADGGGADEAAERVARFVERAHAATVVGLSVSAEGVAAGAAAACASGADRVGLVEDMPATGLRTVAAAEARCGRDGLRAGRAVLLVGGDAAARVIREHAEHGPELDVVGTGSPQFDGERRAALASPEQHARGASERRRRARRALGIRDDEPFVLIAGQTAGTAEVVEMVVGGLARAGALAKGAKVMLSQHPRAPADDVEAAARAVDGAPPGVFLAPSAAAEAGFASSEAALAAADVVVSGYSTTNLHAILQGGFPGVVYAATPTLRGKYRREKTLRVPPEVEAGAAFDAGDAGAFARAVEAVWPHADTPAAKQVLANQRALSRLHDGHAAERAWRAIAGAHADTSKP